MITATGVLGVTRMRVVCTSAQKPIPYTYARRFSVFLAAHCQKGRTSRAVTKITAKSVSLWASIPSQYFKK